jgi:hypothetical protein
MKREGESKERKKREMWVQVKRKVKWMWEAWDEEERSGWKCCEESLYKKNESMHVQ